MNEYKTLGIIQLCVGFLVFSIGGLLNIAITVGIGVILIIFGTLNYKNNY